MNHLIRNMNSPTFMNTSVNHLANIAEKKERIILGLMSGTSMDGLDLALCRVAGHGMETTVDLLEFSTVSYPEDLQKELKKIVSVSQCNLEDVCLMNSCMADFTVQAIREALDAWGRKPASVDCIASHGQTIYHAPKSKHQRSGFPHATLQIGDGDHIAHGTGILTISDFRQKHTAAGGEGAPMVALVDRVLFNDPVHAQLLLNIGGIANFTYLPKASSGEYSITADTGPGNTLLDEAARQLLDQPFDDEGRAARRGEVNQSLLDALKSNPYFDLELPKTTGPERFNWTYVQNARQSAEVKDLSPDDMLATLTAFTADTIARAVRNIHPNTEDLRVLASGGGIHNTFLMECLEERLPGATFQSFGETYFNPDAKEAVCFAVLANETLSGKGFYIDPSNQTEKVNFGKISFPD